MAKPKPEHLKRDRIQISMPKYMLDYLKSEHENISDYIRTLIFKDNPKIKGK